jgi:hypothetical protein
MADKNKQNYLQMNFVRQQPWLEAKGKQSFYTDMLYRKQFSLAGYAIKIEILKILAVVVEVSGVHSP